MTLKLFKTGIHTTMGLTAVAAIGLASGVFDANENPSANHNSVDKKTVAMKSAPVNTQQKSAEETVAFEDTIVKPTVPSPVVKPVDKKENGTTGTTRPQFDVLRVEKDGSVVVAGNAAPNSQVDIMRPDGAVIGQARTGAEGDFVFALEDILAPGNHVIGLRSTGADGVKLRSAQTGIIRIPEAEGDVLAMVSEDGEVSRILMKPAAFEQPETTISKRENISQPPATMQEAPSLTEQLANSSKEKATLQHPVLVEAVEVEGQQVFVAGAVMQGELVRVYLDNVAIGTTRGTRDNRFLLSKKFDLKPGMHAVRIDVINEKTGGVWSRAEVGLQHDLPEEVLKVEALEQPKFSSFVADKQPDVQLAGLSTKLRQSIITDGNARNLALNTPHNPLQSSDNPTFQNNDGIKSPDKSEDSSSIKLAAAPAVSQQKFPSIIRTGRAIIIKPGDNLWRISQRTYGQGIRYTTIFNANRNQIRDPNLIYAGQIFKIPEKAVQ